MLPPWCPENKPACSSASGREFWISCRQICDVFFMAGEMTPELMLEMEFSPTKKGKK